MAKQGPLTLTLEETEFWDRCAQEVAGSLLVALPDKAIDWEGRQESVSYWATEIADGLVQRRRERLLQPSKTN